MNSNNYVTCQICPFDSDQTFVQSFNWVLSCGEHTVQPDQQHSVPVLLVALRTFESSDLITMTKTCNIYTALTKMKNTG